MISNNYLAWLAGFVCLDDDIHDLNNYSLLFEKLYSEVFEPMMDMDDNRALDGTRLRTVYRDEVGYHGHWMRHLKGECSWFEMLVALSDRCRVEYGMEMFWVMMDISGFILYSDDNFDEMEVEYIIDQLNNIYSPVSLFDESKELEIWAQAMNYILKHFDYSL